MPETTTDARFEQARTRFMEGLRCFQTGDWAGAESHYLAALHLVPGRPSTLINLAATRLRLGRAADALADADAVLAAETDCADALLHRATALSQLGRPQAALDAFDRLLVLDPGLHPAWSGRGSLLRELQRPLEAAAAFRKALQCGADPELHAFYLAAVDAGAAPAQAPNGYVQELFDSYAGEFDAHLVGQLHYEGHRRLVDGLQALAPETFASALDLGCGTGLCGPLLRPLVQRLDGVDLSPGMIDKARALGVYDRLDLADAADHLSHGSHRYDLVVAADVFIYVGNLDAVFLGVARVMERGVFCFTVEVGEGAGVSDGPDYVLLPSLRYAHTPRYLRHLAAAHGFEPISMHHAPVRQDQRSPVEALYVYLRRAGYDAAA